MFTFMNDEQLGSLPDDKLMQAFGVAASHDISEGMLDSWSNFIPMDTIDEINAVIGENPIFGGPNV